MCHKLLYDEIFYTRPLYDLFCLISLVKPAAPAQRISYFTNFGTTTFTSSSGYTGLEMAHVMSQSALKHFGSSQS
ncbi:MAG: hypothetical protein IPK03_17530 [Bacteroidetes bacterium]|nr:hypothetical protein [Bacteroidota bacterium]